MKTGLLSVIVGSLLVAMTTSGAQTLTLGADPVVTIGEGADPSSQFNDVVGVTRLSSGEIAVVNVMPPEIRLFSAGGEFERLVARRGSGPGELSFPYWFGQSGDSLFAYDFGLTRITVFDMRADHVTTAPFAPTGAPGRMAIIGHLSGHSWLAYTVQPFPQPGEEPLFRDTTTVGIWRDDSTTIRTIGRFPNVPYLAIRDPGSARMQSTLDRLRPWTAFLAIGSRIWVGIPESEEILVYDANGSLATRIPVPFPHRPFAPDDARRARDRILASARTAAGSDRLRLIYDVSKRKDMAPALSRLLPGRSGLVWVEQYREDANLGGVPYAALDATGRIVRRLQSPPGVRLFDIDDDYAVGVRRNADDVETVVVYRIVR